MIRLRFVNGLSIISAGIRAAEYGFWCSHVEAVMRDGTLLGAHAAGGVMERPRDYDTGEFSREQFVDLRSSPEMEDTFEAFLRAQVGRPYDFSAILAFVARRDWQEPDSWFCSELQAAALVTCGWLSGKLGTEANHITPRDLLLMLSARSDAKFI